MPGGSWPRSRAPCRQPSASGHAPTIALLAHRAHPDPSSRNASLPSQPILSPWRWGAHVSGRGAGGDPAEQGGLQHSAPRDPRAHKGPFVAAARARKETLSRGGGCFLPAAPQLGSAQRCDGEMGAFMESRAPCGPHPSTAGGGGERPAPAGAEGRLASPRYPPLDRQPCGPQCPACRGR